jgi:hypothetical protein
MKYVLITAIVFVVAIVAGSEESVFAAKLYVAANGVDSAACGEKKSPCRSISRAIQNAINGDTIVVGPGRYGDLNGDGVFDDPGDEAAEVGGGCYCMIKVNKLLTIEAQDGAAATVLDAGGADLNVVRIEFSGTVFGKKKKGFTLTQAGSSGLFILPSAAGVRVIGNVAIANGTIGFNVNGSGNVLTGNVASANRFYGFYFDGNGNVFTGNVASVNGGDGFSFNGNGHVLTGNVANANSSNGFYFNGSGHVLTGNVASANGFSGFNFSGSGHVLTGNSALVNKRSGIFIFNSEGVDSATITKNNLFGNNGQQSYSFTNCGLLNQSGNSISAPNNFWGVAAGPGTLNSPQPEPADNVCDSPYSLGSNTTFAPFSAKEFKVKVKVSEELSSDAIPTEANFQLSPRTRFDFHLYTLKGQLLVRVADEAQLVLTKHNLPNGVYVAVKIYADGRREMVKWVVAK